MANTFLEIKTIARQALPRLMENLVFPNLVHKDFAEQKELGKGAVVQVRKPVVLTAQEFTGSVTAQDVAEECVEVHLDKLATVDVAFGAIERTNSVDDLNRLFIEPAAAALAQKINADGLALFAGVTNAIKETNAASLHPFVAAAKALNDANVPLTPRYGVWSAEAEAQFRTVEAIIHAEKCGNTEALHDGSIGRIFGIDNYMCQGVTDMLGCVFHPYAFAFVTRPLAAPAGVESYTTSYNGISLRVTRGYDMKTKTEMLSMDVLYGYKLLDPALAVKVTQ